jgi:RNA polymerase sigma factor (sigma-70 family)
MTEPGAESGLKKLYLLHRTELTRFLVARTGDREEAEDLIQELWVKMEKVSAGPIANGRAYLFRMAHNLVLDRRRERGRRARRERDWLIDESGFHLKGEEIADTINVDDLVAAKDEVARMIAAIATLPEGAQRVFRMHVIEDVPHAEIAARLGISKSGVEKHMAVAIKYLRRALAEGKQGQ